MANYAESLLAQASASSAASTSTGSSSWRTPGTRSWRSSAAAVLTVLSVWFAIDGVLWQALGVLTLVLFVYGILAFLWGILRYRNEEYLITNRRLIHAEGVVNKKTTDSSLEKINDAVLTESMFGRMFGFGDLDVLTASEEGIERLRMLRDAKDFKKAMIEAKHELEVEVARPVMPPIRSEPAAVAAAPVAAPAPAAPPPTPVPAAPGSRRRRTTSARRSTASATSGTAG